MKDLLFECQGDISGGNLAQAIRYLWGNQGQMFRVAPSHRWLVTQLGQNPCPLVYLTPRNPTNNFKNNTNRYHK